MRTVILSVAAVLLALVAGPPGQRVAAAPKSVVIGLSVSLSGEFSAPSSFQLQGYQLWVQDQNARGGLLGRPVQLKIYDDESEPQISTRLYEKLITQDRVDLIIGPFGSAVTSAASTVAEKYHMVMLAPSASAPAIFKRGYKFIFQIPPTARSFFVGAIEIARKEGYKTVAFLGEDSAYAHDAVPGTADYARAHEMQVLYQEYYPPKTTEFTSFLAHVRAANPDVLINAGYTPEDLAVLRQLKGLGIDVKMLALEEAPSLPDWPSLAGKDGDYVFVPSPWDPSVKTPGNRQFVVQYAKQFNRVPDYHAAQAYGAGQILAMAVEGARSLDQEMLRDAIAKLNVSTVFSRFQVDSTGAQSGAKVLLGQWQHGTKQVVWPFDVVTAHYLLPMPSWSKR